MAQLKTSDSKPIKTGRQRTPGNFLTKGESHASDHEVRSLDPKRDETPSGGSHPVDTSNPMRRGDENYSGNPCGPCYAVKGQHL